MQCQSICRMHQVPIPWFRAVAGDRGEDRLQWEKKRIYRIIKNYFCLFGQLHLSLHLPLDVSSFMLQKQYWLMTITYVRDVKKVKLDVPSLSFEIKLMKSFSLLKKRSCHVVEERKEQSGVFCLGSINHVRLQFKWSKLNIGFLGPFWN